MTANDILSHWERVKPMLTEKRLREGTIAINARTLWMAMLYTVRKPITSPSLAETMGISSAHASAMLKLMEKNQLVQVDELSRLQTSAGLLYIPLPLLSQILGVEPLTPQPRAPKA